MSAELNGAIRPAYFAALTSYVTYEALEIPTSHLQSIRPDTGVPQREPARLPGQATGTIDPPNAESMVVLEMPLELLSIEAHQVGTDRRVTAIDILSPVNKQRNHEARLDYLRKRRDLLRSQTHFMEIDLLRGGERTPLDTPVPDAPYYLTLSRVERRPRRGCWH